MRPTHSAIDAISRQVWIDSEPHEYNGDTVLAALSARDSLVIVAHGEGAHCNLGSFVICGVKGQETVEGHPVADGCIEHVRCKRAEGYNLDLLATDSVEANLVALLVCNAASETTRMYPSGSSVAQRLVDLGKTVLAPTRPLDVSPTTVTQFLFEAHQHDTLDELAQSLNQQYRAPTFFRVASPAGTPQKTAFMPPLPTPNFEASEQLARSSEKLSTFVARNALIVDGLQNFLHVSKQADSEIPSPLAAATLRLANLNNRIFGLSNQIHARTTSQPLAKQTQPASARELLNRLPAIWQDAMNSACAAATDEQLSTDAVLLYATTPADQRISSTRCARCGTPLRDATLTSSNRRIAGTRSDCDLCGLQSVRTHSHLVDISVPSSVSRTEALNLIIRRQGVAELPSVTVHLRDKGRGRDVYAHSFELKEPRTHLVIPRETIARMVPDLHTLTIAAFAGFDAQYQRLRISVV